MDPTENRRRSSLGGVMFVTFLLPFRLLSSRSLYDEVLECLYPLVTFAAALQTHHKACRRAAEILVSHMAGPSLTRSSLLFCFLSASLCRQAGDRRR